MSHLLHHWAATRAAARRPATRRNAWDQYVAALARPWRRRRCCLLVRRFRASITAPATENHRRRVKCYRVTRTRRRPDHSVQPGNIHQKDLPVLAHHDRSVAYHESTLAEPFDRSCLVQSLGQLVKVSVRLSPARKLLYREYHGALSVEVAAGIEMISPGRGGH